MIHIAILGFGVVGSGVAEVLSTNASELAARLDGEQLNIKHIRFANLSGAPARRPSDGRF